MASENILNCKLEIIRVEDERKEGYYRFNLVFSGNDVVSIYRNSLKELNTELPEIISLAIGGRLPKDEKIEIAGIET